MAEFNLNEGENNLDEKIKERNKKREEEMEGEKQKPRFNFQDGLNVVWVLPGLGDTVEPVNHMLIHYYPFHRCGRVDPIPDSSKESNFRYDRRFSNCYRCQTAWDHYEDAGKPGSGDRNSQPPEKRKFKNDMENHRAVMQVVNLNPFFKMDSDGVFAEPHIQKVKKWGDDFVQIMEDKDQEDYEPPEHVPDDVVKAAMESPSVVTANKDLGSKITKEHRKACKIEGEDPLGYPDRHLLSVQRSNDGSSFTGRGGEKRYGKKYDVEFMGPNLLKDWQLPDGFMKTVQLKAVDILNQKPEEDTLKARARAFEKFDDETMKEFLKESDHTFKVEDSNIVGDEEVNPDEFESSDNEVDPDDFQQDNTVLGTESELDEEEVANELSG